MTASTALSAADLRSRAPRIRADALRMIAGARSGHPGGSLSAVDILLALYMGVLRHDPARPDWEGRDRFILSKGHACPALYAVLAECGYFPRELLWTFRSLGSPLQGHPELGKLAGVEASTGSLGQGLSLGLGMMLGHRVRGIDARVHVLLGDGEINEGQVWEAALSAAHLRADRLTAIVDVNRIQLDGFTSDILELEPLADKWKAFGWEVFDLDGHNLDALLRAFADARGVEGRPQVILARTTKGKGVSFMEDNPEFHGAPPTAEELERALQELGVTHA
ncbi:MAG: transketolase [Candidatus Sericytochromatia bacterium]|nr:transketolase [Candidatus Sericytochromatia bacterium]